MPRFFSLLAAFALLVSSAGAAQPSSFDRAVAGKSEGSDSKGDYVLQPSDLLKVMVFQEEDFTREVRISQEYTISLPLINTVDLSGKTRLQAEELIRKLLISGEFLKNPGVTVHVVEYVPRRVFVSGAVTEPGAILFHQEQGLTLIDAISKAKGFNRLADQKKVTLKRRKPDGSTETTTINVADLMKGESNLTWPLQPNDVITVPEKIL